MLKEANFELLRLHYSNLLIPTVWELRKTSWRLSYSEMIKDNHVISYHWYDIFNYCQLLYSITKTFFSFKIFYSTCNLMRQIISHIRSSDDTMIYFIIQNSNIKNRSFPTNRNMFPCIFLALSFLLFFKNLRLNFWRSLQRW